jgi:hypothetical protein
MTSEERAPGRRGGAHGPRGWAEPVALGLFFVVLSVWSWGKWTDVHIDFGNELYLAWQIASGKALYHEMAYRQGPLSPHLNALWFSLFGVSIRTLALVNLGILAVIAALTWRIFDRACGRVAATATVAVLLGVFSFSQYTPIANYNYVTPYHHQQTHGVALSLAMFLLLGSRRDPGGRSAPGRLALAGACLGAVFLTKAELFVPAAAAGLTGLALQPGGRRGGVAFALGSLAPPLIALAALASRMPLESAVAGTLGNWSHLGSALGDFFYWKGAGLDAPGRNLVRGLRMLVALAAFLALALALERLIPSRRRVVVASGIGLAAFAALVAFPGASFWLDLPRALPFATLMTGAWLVVSRVASSPDTEPRPLLAMWTLWSLLLLAKLGLHARIHHYGFVLAMPATLLLVAMLVAEIPRSIRIRWGGGEVARALGIAGVVALLVVFFHFSDRAYARKTLPVGERGDRILVEAGFASARGGVVVQALEQLRARMQPRDTLLVLPEGISLNYWLRKENPSRYHLFLPTELAAFGREAILQDVRESAPEYIALVHRGPGEFGVGAFGVDPRNGRAISEWVHARYERLDRIGAEPFGDQGFGIVLLRRFPVEAGESRR